MPDPRDPEHATDRPPQPRRPRWRWPAGRGSSTAAYASSTCAIIPYRIEELAYFVPTTPPGSHLPTAQINDVFVDEAGLIYAVERIAGGLYILEYSGPVPLS